MGDVFKPLVEDLEHNSDGWSEWIDLPQPEEVCYLVITPRPQPEEVGTLPGGGGPTPTYDPNPNPNPNPNQVGTLPGGGGPIVGDWERNLTALQRLLLLRAMRPDRVTTAMAMFISATLGARYTSSSHPH